MEMAEKATQDLRAAKRNVAVLAAAQAILGSVAPMSISIGSLAGYQLLGPDKALATLPVTGYNLGVSFGAVLIAIVTRMAGRKLSFMLGACSAALGGLVAVLSLYRENFWLFVVGLLMIGLSSGFTQKIRFAAADVSPPAFKAEAISWILAAGIVSAVLGPQLVIWLKDAMAPITFAGTFVTLLPLMALAIVILSFVHLPVTQKVKGEVRETGRPLLDIVLTPRFLTGLICGISTYALMTFVMTGAPLAMVVGCGFTPGQATLGIQWHVIAMFGPSFFTGKLIARYGAERIVGAGLLLLMACALTAHAGIELWNFWAALVLLGIGWNFGFIGATAIVASSYRPEEADKVQAFHDILLFSSVAIASFSSGKVFAAQGWTAITFVIWPVTIVCLGLLVMQFYRGRQTAG
ncbi:MFS transporter [Allorhizobium sp. BGMRC 0089]|uniref:MFS transporter n=1 Tax=Allorhizobium sonneratiae TaxID=2934936 RepID=UPI00203454F6|nr:MFS transporter [Allorhizobium sonneratiae]MCM2292123.1 MFS transporter [Allorhizobium sonneratiae]